MAKLAGKRHYGSWRASDLPGVVLQLEESVTSLESVIKLLMKTQHANICKEHSSKANVNHEYNIR